MLMFAILYFAVMSDAGLFDPLVRAIVRFAHGDPVRVLVGSAALALLVSLDGDGSTTYMIVVAAMLPLYERLGLDRLKLTCVLMMASGVMNVTPWGGPTARAASALHVDPGQIFVPMLGAMLAGTLWILFVAYRFGVSERRRLATGLRADPSPADAATSFDGGRAADPAVRRPNRLAANAVLTAALMTALVLGLMPLPVLFMIGFALAMMLNYPTVAEQKARVAEHAGNVFAVSGLIFAAGIFTGILAGTKMVDAMATSVVHVIPTALGPYLAIVTALVSIPFTFFISNDAFYFGVLPILAQAAAAYGIDAAAVGRASIVGQPVHLLSPLVPSTYLLVGLAGVELGDHQRYALRWTFLTSLVMLAVAVLTGVIPLRGG
jgi:CitMHS family citrate-Mg2+:H+ or citrate-Ca2+:H+ symporter